ncbi:protein translocase subunit SecD [Altererythrobacter sp. FM1]|uniref:Protein translocase subunit SecD n=1 Tax=Tsuneonella flava TaxID=2055955 RepID=A0ABX7K860_9SPHN|nr:protein translocase subunit SecD [Tsuneonella flava]QSB43417.1 protein translocase subunit SecD [Tsuneonella flava]ROT94757.1 protein translocase subunit SecD [Altererythrobacter sp. FM1]
MLDFPRWKKIWLWGLVLAVAIVSLPTVVSLAGQQWPASLPDPKVNLGLDLAGGSQILLEADPRQITQQKLESMEETVRTEMRKASPAIRIGDVSTAGDKLSFMVESASDVDRARELLMPMINGTGMTREWTLSVVDETRIVLTPTKEGLDTALDQAMDSAKDVIDRRINAIGTLEPTIIRQDVDRIVVQAPGQQNPEALKELIGKTAKLEFKLVDLDALPADVQAGRAPAGSEILPYAEGGQKIAVRRLGGIKGDNLVNAQQGFEQQTNQPVVNITFDQQGADKFARLTTQNVNKPFAIILDGKVLSAPNINEPIRGGTASISGGFTVESANQLAIALRSGALPVDLKVIEQRTVNPELGKDSIERGLIAMGVGTGLVLLFMLVTYGRFGFYANCALVLNVLMILGIMAVMNATLTLPGLAGFVLTIGAAVDANVLINERIREERRRGRRVLQAVETGYKEASRAIYDANITNVIAATLLFLFGQGPVKGFAVVLVIGVITTMFTAVTITRMWAAGWLRRTRPSDIHI